ncbi:2-oxoglutarate and iron-dependent oxygenase JMJD4 isoform X1 [Phyllopteryx taeniolatus]|uniref:2-oxoglutarate and iron-dependent oxygenase JMJD4 n=1 Tax=Phycodurus eques TaxID=693459 RepID=UPI002ACD9E72|nr:2-oxoglutarate and iron-dependent oxygenase JMJD4 [Phycodurus eques]XP_061653608.1 2-oxoglutarate and iron-dependent oxygenase JMJD4 isoform X1 [Phyllopteryx taeniolatus]
MDRDAYRNCSSLVKIPRQSYDQFCSSHFVDYIDNDLCYSKFFKRYLLPNHPCVFSKRFTDEWKCRKQWVTEEGKPHFQKLLQEFGETPVPVANCNAKEYNANPKQVMPFKEFIQYWKEHIQNGHSSPKGCLYLKDWHMARDFPEHHVYTTPIFFTSDWLNEYWDALEVDDYRFVYMGPKGSWTPFHADVFRSYSWSANICGRKKWLLYPPGQEEFLRDTHGNLPFDVTSADLRDGSLFPRFPQAGQPLEIIQEAGEIIFVPSGWHHQVYNLEDTISINHNWLNGCNVDIMWQFLQNELSSVQKEIDEWRNTMDSWHQHCQVIMKACSGIDYGEFASFLKIVADNRMTFLNARPPGDAADYPRHPSEALVTLGPYHAAFDLQRVAHILELLLCNEDFKRLDRSASAVQPETLLQQIRETIQSTRGQHLLYQD